MNIKKFFYLSQKGISEIYFFTKFFQIPTEIFFSENCILIQRKILLKNVVNLLFHFYVTSKMIRKLICEIIYIVLS